MKRNVCLSIDVEVMHRMKTLGVNVSELAERAFKSCMIESSEPSDAEYEADKKRLAENKLEIQRLLDENNNLVLKIVGFEQKREIASREHDKAAIQRYDDMKAAGWLEEMAKYVHGDYDGKENENLF